MNSRGEIKLCDFGVSRILDDSKASTFIGTVAYMPPERFTDGWVRYDFRSEIWSLGITILEFIVGKLPYVQNEENMDIITLQNLIKEYKFTRDKILETYSKDLKSFIESCLKPVSERPKLEMLFDMEAYKRHENDLLSEEYYELVKRAIESKKKSKNIRGPEETMTIMLKQNEELKNASLNKFIFPNNEAYDFNIEDIDIDERVPVLGHSRSVVNHTARL
uniref:mitogen-activated protein kinase kinase n=1 Tax=Acrobeloides nanus TaxID=290746 RepID=A0A914DBW9_9BILA